MGGQNPNPPPPEGASREQMERWLMRQDRRWEEQRKLELYHARMEITRLK